MANGFSYACSHEWSNLGQGAPEVGPIPDAPDRPTSIPVPEDSLEYAPTTGVKGPCISLSCVSVICLSLIWTSRYQIFVKPSQTSTIILIDKERLANIPTRTSASSLVGGLGCLGLLLSSEMCIRCVRFAIRFTLWTELAPLSC